MKHLFNGFYSGKTVLVTGHTGFKGSWLAAWLSMMGATVIGLSKDKRTRLCVDEKGLINLCNFDAVLNCLKLHKPDLIFHLAAQPLVIESFLHPLETVDDNIFGTVNLLTAVTKACSETPVVVVTSDKVYSPNGGEAFCESDELGGNSVYAATKACVELLVHAWIKNYNLNIATARAGNVIGGIDFGKNRLIPDCVRHLKHDEPIIIRNPNHTRPWQHVLDCLQGYLLLGKHISETEKAGAFNFAPEHSESVLYVVQNFLKHWGSGSYRVMLAPNAYEDRGLSLNSTKAKEILGWKPVLTLDEAIEWTVDWWKHEHDPDRTAIQLERYIALSEDREWACDPNWLSNLTP